MGITYLLLQFVQDRTAGGTDFLVGCIHVVIEKRNQSSAMCNRVEKNARPNLSLCVISINRLLQQFVLMLQIMSSTNIVQPDGQIKKKVEGERA